MVPGLLSDSRVWAHIAEVLSANFRIHFAETRRHDCLTEMAKQSLHEVDEDVIVFGHSMGGRVAMEIWNLAPERVRAMVLADTGFESLREGEEAKRQAKIDIGYESMTELREQWLPPMVHEPLWRMDSVRNSLEEMVDQFTPEVHESQIKALVNRPNAKEYLSKFHCPVLLMVGRQDYWSPVSQHEEAAKHIQNVRVSIIEEAGHFAPFEQPEAVGKEVRNWLTEHQLI